MRTALCALLTGMCLMHGQVLPQTEPATATLANIPLSFEPNQGQAEANVRFLSGSGNNSVQFTDSVAVLRLGRGPDLIKMELLGKSANSIPRGEAALPGIINYLIGNDASKWKTNIPTYSRIRYDDVYPGIGLVYYGNHNQLEYDFVVQPKADPNRIRLHFAGAKYVKTTAQGDLTITAATGAIAFLKPTIYQERAGARVPVNGKFRLLANQIVGFSVGSYDAALPLVIDPTLAYSTYFSSVDTVATTVDPAGNIYLTGSVYSPRPFPVTGGAYQTGPYAGKYTATLIASTAYVAKLNPSGTGLVYATYLGGSQMDIGTSIAADSEGNAYVAGQTSSLDFPITSGAFQPKGTAFPLSSAFVAKLNPAGTSLIYSTYFGSNFYSLPIAIALDSSGSVYLGGGPVATRFLSTQVPTNTYVPTTQGSFQPNNKDANAFVAKLNPAGTGLTFSTYLGGTGNDTINSVAVDQTGNVFVAGSTTSLDFPAAQGKISRAGSAFVTKLKADGSNVVYSSVFGGTDGTDTASAIAVDSSGNAYVTGSGRSSDFPTTPGAFNTQRAPGTPFITKLGSSGAIAYSTRIGPGSNGGNAIAVDKAGNAYVVCNPNYGKLPLTTDAYSTNSGPYLLVLNAAGTNPLYATYFGAGLSDTVTGVSLDASGNAYLTGMTNVRNFPVTPGAFQTALSGGMGAYVAKFVFPIAGTPVIAAVVNSASSVAGVVPGSIATIYGTNLSPTTDSWNNAIINGMLPTLLDGVSVSVDGQPAYVSYVSPGQINFVVPSISAGAKVVQVSVPGSAPVTFTALAGDYSPAFFLLPNNQPVATHLDYSVAAKNGTFSGVTTVPAKPGEVLILWGTGFGPTAPAAPVGIQTPSSQIYQTTTLPSVNISNLPARVISAALAPGFAGLYQIAVQIPASLGNGDWPVIATIGGVTSEIGIILTISN